MSLNVFRNNFLARKTFAQKFFNFFCPKTLSKTIFVSKTLWTKIFIFFKFFFVQKRFQKPFLLQKRFWTKVFLFFLLFKLEFRETLNSFRDWIREKLRDTSDVRKERKDKKKNWENDEKEIQWREGIKPGDIIDAQNFEGEWNVGKVGAIGNDPTIIVVFFHGKSNWEAENVNRYEQLQAQKKSFPRKNVSRQKHFFVPKKRRCSCFGPIAISRP